MIPLYIEMKHLGWLNHLQAVIAPSLVSAFGVFLMRQYIVASVPNELIDASRVDGCHDLRSSGTWCCPPSGRPRQCSGCSRS